MANVEIREYQRYTPQTIGERVLSLSMEAQHDGTFLQREIVGVGVCNRTLDEAISTAMKAVDEEQLHPYVICRDEEIVGVASVMTGLDLYKIRYPIVPVKLARKSGPLFSKKIQGLGVNVFAWTTAQHTRDGVLSEAYSQIVNKGLDVSGDVWTVEPQKTSYYVTEAIKEANLKMVDYGYYDDGEATTFIQQKYGLYIAWDTN